MSEDAPLEWWRVGSLSRWVAAQIRQHLQDMLGYSQATMMYSIDGIQHFNVTDLAMYHVTPPLGWLFPFGTIEPQRALRIEADLVDAFSDEAFGGQKRLGDVAAAYPEVRAI